jgi:hypothetical protein
MAKSKKKVVIVDDHGIRRYRIASKPSNGWVLKIG